MVTSTSQPTLQDLAHDAAAGVTVTAYLDARGVKTVGTLALQSRDEDELHKVLIQPLFDGWKKDDGTILTLPESEKPIAKAVLLHMWSVARVCWNKAMTTASPAPSAPGGSAPSATSATEDKVPKTLAPGKWTSMVTAYQAQQVGGKDRVFPTIELVGTESVLARVVHEIEVSKSFTPILLGELISLRTFLPNPLSKKDRTSTKLQLSGETLTATQEEPWQPRSVLAIMDGLNSIRWAYILCSIGSEQSVREFIDWAIRVARSRPQKTEQFTQYWLTTGWKLATMMRAGKTFDESTAVIMRDYDAFSECMAREPTTPKKPQTSPKPLLEKGYGKGNSKNGKQRYSPYTRTPTSWNSSNFERQDRPWPKQTNYTSADDKMQSSGSNWTSEWKSATRR